MDNLTKIAFLLGGWANSLPTNVRKRIYQTVKVLSGLATLALLVLPLLPGLGVEVPTPARWDALFTAALAFLGHLADKNTHVEPAVEMFDAPETAEPVEPPSEA